MKDRGRAYICEPHEHPEPSSPSPMASRLSGPFVVATVVGTGGTRRTGASGTSRWGTQVCVTAGARTQPTCCLPLTVEVTGPHEPGSWSLMEQLLWESRDPAGLTIPFYRGRNRDPGTFFTRDWLGDRQALGLRSLKAPNTLKSLDTGSPSSSGKGYKCSYFRCADMPRDSAVV